MLAFFDESGDSGFKLAKGSSKYFCVALVIFEDVEEALACDHRIELLKRELGWDSTSEFHFKKNSNRVRQCFLEAVAPYNFFYYGFVLNKDPKKLWGDGFKDKKSFYKYVCGLVFENAKPNLDKAIVVIDESGNLDFKRQLSRYLKRKINTRDNAFIKKVKMQRSTSNNLIQLADYVVGVIGRSVGTKKKGVDFRTIISHREIRVQIWPR